MSPYEGLAIGRRVTALPGRAYSGTGYGELAHGGSDLFKRDNLREPSKDSEVTTGRRIGGSWIYTIAETQKNESFGSSFLASDPSHSGSSFRLHCFSKGLADPSIERVNTHTVESPSLQPIHRTSNRDKIDI